MTSPNPSRPALRTWIHALRLRSLPLALASIILGTCLAAADHRLRWPVLILAALTAALLQILSNFANDYGDTLHGADHAGRQGPARTVASGAIAPATMRRAIVLCAGLAAVTGLGLIAAAALDPERALVFVALGGCALAAAITYTMGRYPYGYAGLGDIMVLLFFGWAGVVGTYVLHSGSFAARDLLPVLLPATSLGLLAVAVLNINNTRDIDSDRVAGKITIPVRLGPRGARVYHWGLLAGAAVLALVYVALDYRSPAQFLWVLTLPLGWRHGWAVWRADTAQTLDPQLRRVALIGLLFAITFGCGQVI